MQIKQRIIRFFQREDGASAIEYALMAAMVAVAITLIVPEISTTVKNIFTGINSSLTKASG